MNTYMKLYKEVSPNSEYVYDPYGKLKLARLLARAMSYVYGSPGDENVLYLRYLYLKEEIVDLSTIYNNRINHEIQAIENPLPQRFFNLEDGFETLEDTTYGIKFTLKYGQLHWSQIKSYTEEELIKEVEVRSKTSNSHLGESIFKESPFYPKVENGWDALLDVDQPTLSWEEFGNLLEEKPDTDAIGAFFENLKKDLAQMYEEAYKKFYLAIKSLRYDVERALDNFDDQVRSKYGYVQYDPKDDKTPILQLQQPINSIFYIQGSFLSLPMIDEYHKACHLDVQVRGFIRLLFDPNQNHIVTGMVDEGLEFTCQQPNFSKNDVLSVIFNNLKNNYKFKLYPKDNYD